MGGETEEQVSGWTTDTLKAFVAELTRSIRDELAALDRRTAEIRAEDQKAITKAENAAESARVALRDEAKTWKNDHNNLIAKLGEATTTHSDAQIRMTESLASKEALGTLERAMDTKFERIEKFQNRIAGAVVMVGMIGVANLVKIWGN